MTISIRRETVRVAVLEISRQRANSFFFFFFFVVPTRDRSPLYLTAYVKLMHVAFDENLMEIDFAVSNLSSMPFFQREGLVYTQSLTNATKGTLGDRLIICHRFLIKSVFRHSTHRLIYIRMR